MIADLNVGGVLIPGLVVLAIIALLANFALLRLLAAAGFNRLLANRQFAEIATFVIIYGLLVRYRSLIGLLF